MLVLTAVAAYLAIVIPVSISASLLPVTAGQVAQQDVQAPQNLEYISTVRTEEARQAAERAIPNIYTPPDVTIARRQLERLRAALQFIQVTRKDPNTTYNQKQADLLAISDLPLETVIIDQILALGDTRWLSVEQESISVLERIMRNPVHDDNIELIRASVPSLVSLSLNETQSSLVVGFVTPFIVPNSFFSQELTDSARQNARQSIGPITQTYVAGEIIVQRGRVLTPANIEALEKFGLINPNPPFTKYLGAGALMMAMMTFVGMYFDRRRPQYYNEGRSMVLIAALFLTFLVGARFSIPDRTLFPYLYPLPGFGLLIATMFSPGGALILTFALAILSAYGMPNAMDLTIYYLLSSFTGILALGKAQRMGAFVWSALITATTGSITILAYRIPAGELDTLGYVQLIAAAIGNGVASASIALLLQHLLAEFLGLTTPLRLLDISRPDTPLLQFFLRNAPGTYQHSLLVANLAEQAAEKLNMDTMLVRVGALYHDVGKAANPSFFIENQMPGNLNSHEDMLPEEAAASVIRHVTDGVVLGKKYRLPRRIIDFMVEHHGTLVARYQYNQAVEAAGGDLSKVDVSKFTYPGPRPHSRETALLMLSDGVEARARSQRPRDEAEVRAIVQKTIEYCQKEGQLADTRLTLKDLTIITDSFVTTLMGFYHPRINYPGSPLPAASLSATTSPRTTTEKK